MAAQIHKLKKQKRQLQEECAKSFGNNNTHRQFRCKQAKSKQNLHSKNREFLSNTEESTITGMKSKPESKHSKSLNNLTPYKKAQIIKQTNQKMIQIQNLHHGLRNRNQYSRSIDRISDNDSSTLKNGNAYMFNCSTTELSNKNSFRKISKLVQYENHDRKQGDLTLSALDESKLTQN